MYINDMTCWSCLPSGPLDRQDIAVKIGKSKQVPLDSIPKASGTGKRVEVWRDCCDQEVSGKPLSRSWDLNSVYRVSTVSLGGKEKGHFEFYRTWSFTTHGGESMERRGEGESKSLLNFPWFLF